MQSNKKIPSGLKKYKKRLKKPQDHKKDLPKINKKNKPDSTETVEIKSNDVIFLGGLKGPEVIGNHNYSGEPIITVSLSPSGGFERFFDIMLGGYYGQISPHKRYGFINKTKILLTYILLRLCGLYSK